MKVMGKMLFVDVCMGFEFMLLFLVIFWGEGGLFSVECYVNV